MEESKSSLATQDQLTFHEDRPSLFFHIVTQFFTATFSNAQATCDKLSNFHPKRYKYDILQVNNYICTTVKMLKSTATSSGTIMDQEILYFQFKIYKKIKAPAKWTSHILFLKATVATNPTKDPENLFNEAKSKYTNLTNQGLWCPSDKTFEEQTLAMVAQQQQHNKKNTPQTKAKVANKTNIKQLDKNKKGPPFANKEGKLRDTKQWNNKTY